MCTSENTIKYYNDNQKIIEYDIYGDTRNNKKYNEEKKYSKHSYNINEIRRIDNIKKMKELENEEANEKDAVKDDVAKKEKKKKREKQRMYERDEKYGKKYQKIITKTQKGKRPKKDRGRFQKTGTTNTKR